MQGVEQEVGVQLCLELESFSEPTVDQVPVTRLRNSLDERSGEWMVAGKKRVSWADLNEEFNVDDIDELVLNSVKDLEEMKGIDNRLFLWMICGRYPKAMALAMNFLSNPDSFLNRSKSSIALFSSSPDFSEFLTAE